MTAAGVLLGAVLSGPVFAAGGHSSGQSDSHNASPKAPAETKGGQNDGHGGGRSLSYGEAGDLNEVDRTVEIIMTDIEYNLPELSIKAGETIRFVLKNKGEFLHEFNIGLPAMHATHQQEMMAMMENGMMTATEMVKMSAAEHRQHGMNMSMSHDDPNAVIVEPGKTAELIWKFKEAASLQFACNVPGHYESGMVGEFKFSAR
ncbi:MAG: copper-binding protein [Alphaproteobacteria bacterium]|nr:copper-binding protein [Alphaproteobacteria bacterium]